MGFFKNIGKKINHAVSQPSKSTGNVFKQLKKDIDKSNNNINKAFVKFGDNLKSGSIQLIKNLQDPVKRVDEVKKALNQLDKMSGGTLGIVYQGSQIVFPEFGLAVTIFTIADEMIHNNGKLSNNTLKNVLLNKATGGAYGDYQSLRSIEKSELVGKIENKFGINNGVGFHHLPDVTLRGNTANDMRFFYSQF